MAKIKITREQLANPCAGCGAPQKRPSLCCQEFLIETPVLPGDPMQVNLDVLHWYLVRGHTLGWRILTFFPGAKPNKHVNYWQVLVPVACPMLDGAGRCTVYENRPAICRQYPAFPSVSVDNRLFAVTGCERYDPEPEPTHVFLHPDVMAESLGQWFGYQPAREHLRYRLNTKRVRLID
jgi:Fe-S-cluster containining protein